MFREGKWLTPAARAPIAPREKSASEDNLKRPIVPSSDLNQKDRWYVELRLRRVLS